MQVFFEFSGICTAWLTHCIAYGVDGVEKAKHDAPQANSRQHQHGHVQRFGARLHVLAYIANNAESYVNPATALAAAGGLRKPFRLSGTGISFAP